MEIVCFRIGGWKLFATITSLSWKMIALFTLWKYLFEHYVHENTNVILDNETFYNYNIVIA